ncbi:PepSY domain-containing protein [Sinorhizobium meliloti]|uniref:PepSY domain-containing protein n=1 Tax=Rhizobium meliloti TaxID=382 RepID=UPI002D76670E|nr:PepSY domain-containing protein [Sinorhizobium meliloti]
MRIYGGPHKFSFDLHRAGGLWVWAMLFVLAWSSVSFNLKEVYNPVTKAPLPTQAATRFREHAPRLAEPRYQPLTDGRGDLSPSTQGTRICRRKGRLGGVRPSARFTPTS